MTRRRPLQSRNAVSRRSRATTWSMIEMLEGRQLLATFTVNTFADAAAVNAASGDATSTLGAGKITLRSAIQAANATAGASTINLPGGTYTLSIAPTGTDDDASGDLNITGSLTLIGAGAAGTIISVGPNSITDRVLSVSGPGTTNISGVTITGGNVRNSGGPSQGGGIFLYSSANLSLTDAVVTANQVQTANEYGGRSGGGIYNSGGQLTLTRTTVSNNATNATSGDSGGGGIYNGAGGRVTLVESVVRNNSVNEYGGRSFGGGIDNNGGTLVVTNSTVSDNLGDTRQPSNVTSLVAGGGIYNSGQATLTNSTLSGNSAHSYFVADRGAGIESNGGSLVLTDCTVSNNTSGGTGGGIQFDTSIDNTVSSVGPANSIDGCTIAGNNADGGIGGGIDFETTMPVTIRNTILAGNTGGPDKTTSNYFNFPGASSITSLGHNLSTDAETATVFTATGDQNSVADAKLGPLADNGGPTFTQALLAGSPAIDAGDPAGAPATDQRGQPRIQGKTIDIGAYEFAAAASTSPTTTAIASSLNPSQFGVPITLTATVTRTVSSGTPGGQVTFMEGTTTLGSGTIVAGAGGVGVAKSPPLTLPVGKHTVTAVYAGDATFSTSTSTPLVQTVNLRATTTTVTSSVNPAKVGQDVTFTATVDAVTYAAGSAPGDKVTFTVDGGPPTTVPIAVVNGEGQASFVAKGLSAGVHTVVASYGGGAEYAASASKPFKETVTPASTQVATATALTSTPNPSVAGQPVKLTAEVKPLFPVTSNSVRALAAHARQVTLPPGAPPLAGVVVFKDGATLLAVVRVQPDGSATFTTSALRPGRHALTATYAGDPNYLTSTSAPDVQVVQALPAPRVVGVQRYGYHTMPTTLVVGFTTPLDPASAGSAANYRITGPQGEPVGVGLAVYNPAAGTVTLYPVTQLDLHRRYVLTINGSGPGGITGLGGLPLDGAGTGRPGSNYATVVDAANLVVTDPFAPGASAALQLAAWFRAHDRG